MRKIKFGINIVLLFLLIDVLTTCNYETNNEKQKTLLSYREFYKYVDGKEKWLIDTLFLDVKHVCLRYPHTCVLSFEKNTSTHINYLVSKESDGVYVNNCKLDPIDPNYHLFSNASEIICLCEKYHVRQINICHNPRELNIQLEQTNDSIVYMKCYEEKNYRSVLDTSDTELRWDVHVIKP